MSKFLEKIGTIVPLIIPVNGATTANNGDWFSMKHYRRAVVCLLKGAAADTEDPIFKLQQATAVAGTSAKDLTFSRIYEKVGTLTAVGDFTLKTQSAATSYTNTDSGQSEALICVEVAAEDLDVDGGFDCVQLSVADTGTTAQLIAGFAILFDPRYPQATMPSAIAD